MLVTTIGTHPTVANENLKLTQIVPNFNIRLIKDKETVEIILNTDKLQRLEIGKEYIVGIMATKDPTTNTPFDSVSLGYHMHKWVLERATLINLNPPTFRGWKKNYSNCTLVEMWEA